MQPEHYNAQIALEWGCKLAPIGEDSTITVARAKAFFDFLISNPDPKDDTAR